jgi:hypothetical protein
MGINTVIGYDGWGTETKEIGGADSDKDIALRGVGVIDNDPDQGDISRQLQWYINHSKESLTSKKYVDNALSKINLSWSPYKQLFDGGSATYKIGEIQAGYTQVEYKFGLIGGQGASDNSPREWIVSFLTDLGMSCEGYVPEDFSTGDTFYHYTNPDTNAIEIWVVMTGGYRRLRQLAWRTLCGDYVNLQVDWDPDHIPTDPLPTGAIAFKRLGRPIQENITIVDIPESIVPISGPLVYSVSDKFSLTITAVTQDPDDTYVVGPFSVYLTDYLNSHYKLETTHITLVTPAPAQISISLSTKDSSVFNNDYVMTLMNGVVIATPMGNATTAQLVLLDASTNANNQITSNFITKAA